MNSSGLEVRHVSFQYARRGRGVLSDVNFTALPGEIVGVEGANGVGKSTLLSLVAGLFSPCSGVILLNGEPLDRSRRRIAWIAAEFDMFPYLSLGENIAFFLKFYGVAYGDEELDTLLGRYRLTDYQSKPAHAASRGMRRKAQVITSLLQAPDLLLADEPLDGLDEESQNLFIDDLVTFGSRGGIALIALHDHSRATQFVTSHLVLPGGRGGIKDEVAFIVGRE